MQAIIVEDGEIPNGSAEDDDEVDDYVQLISDSDEASRSAGVRKGQSRLTQRGLQGRFGSVSDDMEDEGPSRPSGDAEPESRYTVPASRQAEGNGHDPDSDDSIEFIAAPQPRVKETAASKNARIQQEMRQAFWAAKGVRGPEVDDDG